MKNRINYKISFLFTIAFCNPFICYLLVNSLVVSVIVFLFFTILSFYCWSINHDNWVKVYLANFLILISLLGHFEVIFRYVFTDYIIENLYEIKDGFYFNKPNLDKTLIDKEYKTLYRTNSQGFRISELNDQDQKISNCDWLFIGDSFTQGAQVEFDDLYTSLLYKTFPDKIIVNAGISGLGIADEYYMYEKLLSELKPSKVFLQICNFNDFMNVAKSNIQIIDYVISYSELARFLYFNSVYKPPDQLDLGRWTEPFYKNDKDNIDYNIFYKKSSLKKSQDLKNFESYLKKFNNLIRTNGGELIIVLIPTKEQIIPKYFNEVVASYNISIKDLDMSFPNKFMKGLCDSEKIKLIDATLDLANYGRKVFFNYDEHLSKEGHEVLAKTISKYLNSENNNQINFLSHTLWGDRYPSLLCDGKDYLFQSMRHGNSEIMISSGNDEDHRLTFDDTDQLHPSADCKGNIVYTQGDYMNMRTKIVLMDYATKSTKYLIQDNHSYEAIPYISPDGNYILYAKWFDSPDSNCYNHSNIAMLNLQDHQEKWITKFNYDAWRPVLSNDNIHIVYIANKEQNYDLFLFNMENGNIKQLTETSYDEWDPRFSSDNSKIVYAAYKNNNWDLFIYDIPSKESRQITNTLGNEWDPIFANSDTTIYYAGEYGFLGGIYNLKLN